jgi:hypothetical protein
VKTKRRTVWPGQEEATVMPPMTVPPLHKCPGCFKKHMCVPCLSLHTKLRHSGMNGAPLKRIKGDTRPVSLAYEAPHDWRGQPSNDLLYCSLRCSGGNKTLGSICCQSSASVAHQEDNANTSDPSEHTVSHSKVSDTSEIESDWSDLEDE